MSLFHSCISKILIAPNYSSTYALSNRFHSNRNLNYLYSNENYSTDLTVAKAETLVSGSSVFRLEIFRSLHQHIHEEFPLQLYIVLVKDLLPYCTVLHQHPPIIVHPSASCSHSHSGKTERGKSLQRHHYLAQHSSFLFIHWSTQ